MLSPAVVKGDSSHEEWFALSLVLSIPITRGEFVCFGLRERLYRNRRQNVKKSCLLTIINGEDMLVWNPLQIC